MADCEGGVYLKRAANTEINVAAAELSFDAAYALTTPLAEVGTTAIAAVDNGSGFAFDETNYIGAVAPGTDMASAWWAGWTIEGTVVNEKR